MRCKEAYRTHYLPDERPTKALDFLRWLKQTPEAHRIVEWYGEKAHPILMALWWWWKDKEEPAKSTRRRSTLAMRRKRRTPPKMIRVFINIPGFQEGWKRLHGVEPEIAVPDMDATPKHPGRPKDMNRKFFPPSLMAMLLADLWHEASGGRYRGWSTIKALTGTPRWTVHRLRQQPKVRKLVRQIRSDLISCLQLFLQTGLLP